MGHAGFALMVAMGGPLRPCTCIVVAMGGPLELDIGTLLLATEAAAAPTLAT